MVLLCSQRKEKVMIKIGELSNITGVSIQTIRYYENEGLISPVEVDRWTNYRYYDETSVVRLSEILYLKDLGFSLKEIKNLSEETIKEKISQVKLDIKKLTKNIEKLSTIRREKGGFFMKNFVNDERVVGKWKKLAVVKNKEDFALNKFDDNDIFDFDQIYFLPNGEEYWVFSWTKGILFLKDRQLPYEIIDGKLYIGIVDYKTNTIDNYAVYEKVDSKHYTREEIAIKDNTNIPFILDERVVGFWDAVDYVTNFDEYKVGKKFWDTDLYLTKYVFENDGKLFVGYNNSDVLHPMNWSKGIIINKNGNTVSEYTIKEIDGETIMFVEWKSGDYTFGGKIFGYYVFKKVK